MSFSLSQLRSVLLVLVLVVASGCIGRDLGSTTVVPTGGGASGTVAVTGQLVGLSGFVPVVTIQVFRDNVTLMSQFTTKSEESGRYRIDGLTPGTYRFSFIPPTPDPNDQATELRTIQIGDVSISSADVELPLVIFAPVVDGGMLISDGNPSNQTYQFRVDPKDSSSALVPGLETMAFQVRANTLLGFYNISLAQLGIDDDPSTSARELLVEIAIIRADQLPAAHIDESGDSRTSQVYYALYPAGFDFLVGPSFPRELEPDFPNANGLTNIYRTPQLAFSHLTQTWESAGILDVSFDGSIVETLNFDGPKQTGIIVAPGPPPPTTVVAGQITNGGLPLTRAGITVLTNSGFRDVTDSQGRFRIENVPIPLNCTDMIATAYTDRGLIYAVASNSARPTYPTTTINIELPAVVLTAPGCDLASSEPAVGSVGIETNERIRLRFTGDMSRSSLQAAFSVTATPDGQAAMAIPGKVVTKAIDIGGGVFHTDAFFISDLPLPINSNIVVAVSTVAENKDGFALDAACSLNFRTGTSTLFNPRIDVLEPAQGTVGTDVTIHGINLDIAALTFDSQSLSPKSKNATEFVFTIQSGKGSEAPGSRVVQLDPGAVTDAFVILPKIDSIQIDSDPDPVLESLVAAGSGAPGTLVAGVDQNDGTLVIITGQNLFDTNSGLMPVVRFGFGDGNASSGVDGDAAIDGPDEAASVMRIDVNVPPFATTGELSIIVDDGTGTTFTSPVATFVVDLPADFTAPVVDTNSFDPPENSNGNPISQIIRVEYDEALAGTSKLLIGAGAPLRILPGTTRVTTSLDGKTGILEFFPEAGVLPASSTIQVQLSDATILDLAGNPSASSTFFFSTGSNEPSGTTPTFARGPKGAHSTSGGAFEQGLGGADGDAIQQAEFAGSVFQALSFGTQFGAVNRGDTVPEFVSMQAPFFVSSRLSIDDESISDWADQQPIARWNTEYRKDVTQVSAFYMSHWSDRNATNQGSVTSFVRLGLVGAVPDPSRHFFRFALSLPESQQQITGLISDLDGNGRFELSLFSDTIGDIGVLAREDLIQVGADFIEFEIPNHPALSGSPSFDVEAIVQFESFDLRSSSHLASPKIHFYR